MAEPRDKTAATLAGWAPGLHLAALSAFAVAQPLYELLGNNAEFFPVRGNGSLDILALTAVLSLLAPVSLALLVAATRVFGGRVYRRTQALLVALLVALIALPMLKEPLAYSAPVNLACSLAIGLAIAWAYLNKSAMRLFVTCLAPAILIFPLLFLLRSQVSELLWPPPPPVVDAPRISATAPIVMIVFDELPVSTLMAGKNLLDAARFPGFASLAQDATWYPNATTVAEYTIQALPAILSGRFPVTGAQTGGPKKSLGEHWDLPDYAHHPYNLFTALGGRYELRVFETVSSLCPPGRCAQVFDRNIDRNRRLGDLARDLSVVYGHIVLPRQMSKQLPRIDMNWGDFLHRYERDISSQLVDDDLYAFELFLDSLTAAAQPVLYFHHSGLPHGPWTYLPSGRRYRPDNYTAALGANRRWQLGESIRGPFQRHLLQTMFADRLLQRVIAKLKAEGLYERSIVVVTADHGASFLIGESFRIVDDQNYPEIIDVPLFIKDPGQRQGRIDPTQMRTIDIIPEIFQQLGEPYPWPSDGRLAEDNARLASEEQRVVTRQGRVKTIRYHPDAKLQAVARKLRMIGNGGVGGVFAGPDYARLVGTRPESGCGRALNDAQMLANRGEFGDVRPDSGYVPAALEVRWPGLAAGEVLAVTLNDRIAAVFPEPPAVDKDGYFSAIIDDRWFRAGENRIGFFALERGACGGGN